MPYSFTASEDFDKSISQIATLIQFAEAEKDLGHEDNRILFLKLSIVAIVTKFQVYIESILQEYLYYLQRSNKLHSQIPQHLRLNAIKVFTAGNIIHKTLENPEEYNNDKLAKVKEIAKTTMSFCEDAEKLNSKFQFETKFPLGKTGVNELVKLFKQINGEDIFNNQAFDVNKLNEILGRRHAIIHEDSNSQVTEKTVKEYQAYICEVVIHVNTYLEKHK